MRPSKCSPIEAGSFPQRSSEMTDEDRCDFQSETVSDPGRESLAHHSIASGKDLLSMARVGPLLLVLPPLVQGRARGLAFRSSRSKAKLNKTTIDCLSAQFVRFRREALNLPISFGPFRFQETQSQVCPSSVTSDTRISFSLRQSRFSRISNEPQKMTR